MNKSLPLWASQSRSRPTNFRFYNIIGPAETYIGPTSVPFGCNLFNQNECILVTTAAMQPYCEVDSIRIPSVYLRLFVIWLLRFLTCRWWWWWRPRKTFLRIDCLWLVLGGSSALLIQVRSWLITLRSSHGPFPIEWWGPTDNCVIAFMSRMYAAMRRNAIGYRISLHT